MPDIAGDIWLNSEPLANENLAGKVILVDFWTYTCVNCLRTLPYLRNWWRRYRDHALMIIGIHTPEFEFEKDPTVVADAVEQLGIEWPVVLDNGYTNWNNFATRYWPTEYLVNREGNIVYTHSGEGEYRKTEENILRLLGVGSLDDSGSAMEMEEHVHGGICFRPTPELYCCYDRGYIDNPAGYARDQVASYELPAKLRDDSIALAGKFLASGQYVETAESGAAIHLNFRATAVNLVLRPQHDRALAAVTLNGEPLPEGIRGEDAGSAGELVIDHPSMYNLIDSDQPEQGILAIEAGSGAFQAYAFTFSGCAD